VGVDRFRKRTRVCERVAEVLEDVGGRPAATQVKAIAVDCVLRTSEKLQRGAKIACRRRVKRVALERAAIAGSRPLMLAALAVYVAEEVMRVAAPRIERDHALVSRKSRIERPQSVIHRCEEIPGLCVRRVGDD